MKKSSACLLFLSLGLLPLMAAAESVYSLRGRRVTTGVELRWDNPASPAARSLQVERRIYPGDYLPLATLLSNRTCWTDRSAHPEGLYAYRILSLNAAGEELGRSAFFEILPSHSRNADSLIRFGNNTLSLSTGTVAEFVYSVPKTGAVSVRILTADFAPVRSLVNDRQEAGDYDLSWNGLDAQNKPVRPGVYVVIVSTPSGRESGKIVVRP